MNWIPPKDEHIIYEALSAIADERFKLITDTKAQCVSTSRGKFYEIEIDESTNSIMSNDNMAYYIGEISYPMVAMMFYKNIISFDKDILHLFKGIEWKKINQKNKNNYMLSVKEVLEKLEEQKIDTEKIEEEVKKIFKGLKKTTWKHLGKKRLPPDAY
jgi:DNA-directed RNA polymerase beta subunit